jgi:hypothetical protein
VCLEDCQRDGGIFGASEKSLLSHPTYRVNMLSSSLDDTIHGRGNRKRFSSLLSFHISSSSLSYRHFNPITGVSLDPSATSQAKISTSEFWEFKHIPEMTKGIPGNLQHRGNNEGANGYKFQGTSLRQLQNQRGRNGSGGGSRGSNQRSASAPPASRQHHPMTPDSTRAPGGGGGGFAWQTQKKSPGNRFASTPLAQYLKLKHGRGFDQVDGDDHNVTPMRTSELNSSIASSISFANGPSSGHPPRGNGHRIHAMVLTESHDLRGQETSEIETRP